MKFLVYGFIAILAFVAFLVVSAPASLVMGRVTDNLADRIPGLAIANLEGSVWNGTGVVQYQNLPPATVHWQLEALPLSTGQAETHLEVHSNGLLADASASIDREGGSIRGLNASVTSDYLNVLTLPQGLDLTGQFDLENTSIMFSRNWVTAVDGRLRWNGGIVHISTPAQIISANLPALDGVLSMEGETLILDVTSEREPMMKLRFKPSGWVEVGINHTFLRIAGINMPGSDPYSGGTDPAILLEEKLF